MKRVLLSAIVILFLISQAFAYELSEIVKKVYSDKEFSQLKLNNLNGDIRISGNKTNIIEIVAHKYVKAKSTSYAKEYLSEMEVNFLDNNNELIIESNFPKNKTMDFGFLKEKSIEFAIDFEILLPEKFNLNIKATNGAMVIKNINGEINAKTVNGNFKAINLAGEIDVSSINGNLSGFIENSKEVTGIKFKTVNGQIMLKTSSSISCYLNAEAVNGKISTSFPVDINRDHHGSEAYGEINGGGFRVYLKTVNGGIKFIEL
ncbi:MAG: hypothetical protein KAR38_03225 [Calditrichia bacterium]|nr:hypothetical protein [Calditrichia bacterium]